MPLTALTLVVVAALLHALWNLLLKRTGAGGMALVWAICAATTLVFALPVLFLATTDAPSTMPSTAILVAVGTSAALHTLYFWLLQRGYAVGDLSVVYPIARGVGPLLTVAVAIAWLGERAAPATIGGSLLIVAGTFTVAGGWTMLRNGMTPRAARGLLWGVLTGVVIAIYTVNDGRAVRHLDADPLVYYWLVNLVQTIAMLPFLLTRRRTQLRDVLSRGWRTVLAVGVMSPLAYILVLQAMTMAPVSVVAPVRELSMLFAAFLGVRLLGEGDPWRRVAGAALIAAGVAVLALAGGER